MEDPIAVLQAFFKDMLAWEKLAWSQMISAQNLPDDRRALAMQKVFAPLETIFRRYCTSRQDWRVHKHICGEPSDYDPAVELVVQSEVKGDHATITTSRTDAIRNGEVQIYELVLINGEWRIDQRKKVDGKGRKKALPL